MITEQQFLEAVDLIKQYKIQIDNVLTEAGTIRKPKTLVDDWMARKDISVRLHKALTATEGSGNLKKRKFIWMEDITKREFLLTHFAGRVSWNEFVYLDGDKFALNKH